MTTNPALWPSRLKFKSPILYKTIRLDCKDSYTNVACLSDSQSFSKIYWKVILLKITFFIIFPYAHQVHQEIIGVQYLLS
jgi:hypothetical protein